MYLGCEIQFQKIFHEIRKVVNISICLSLENGFREIRSIWEDVLLLCSILKWEVRGSNFESPSLSSAFIGFVQNLGLHERIIVTQLPSNDDLY